MKALKEGCLIREAFKIINSLLVVAQLMGYTGCKDIRNSDKNWICQNRWKKRRTCSRCHITKRSTKLLCRLVLNADRILILDFGSQYTQLIARRVREAGVYSEIYIGDVDFNAIESFKPSGLILSGGPESAFIDGAPKPSKEIYSMGLPILGICYGMQVMTNNSEEKFASNEREFGHADAKMGKTVFSRD